MKSLKFFAAFTLVLFSSLTFGATQVSTPEPKSENKGALKLLQESARKSQLKADAKKVTHILTALINFYRRESIRESNQPQRFASLDLEGFKLILEKNQSRQSTVYCVDNAPILDPSNSHYLKVLLMEFQTAMEEAGKENSKLFAS